MAKKKKEKIILADEDFNQALDYSYTMSVAYSQMMQSCEVIRSHKAIKAQYEKTLNEMHNLYQLLGREAGK